MTLAAPESILKSLGGLLAFVTLGTILFGIWRGTQRQAGRTTGKVWRVSRSSWFYLLLTGCFIAISCLAWTPLPLRITTMARSWMLVIGSILYFPGMGLVLWGRLALGKSYFVSTGFGAQLFADHKLITHGPYSYVRHPMYLGLMLAALGSLLIYATWTTLLFTCFAPMLAVRARREETALVGEFGEQWREYCQSVPAFLPRARH